MHKVQRSGCEVQRSGPASGQVGKGCSNNSTTTTTITDWTNKHDAAITATCVRAHEFLTNPYTSCSDCCIMLILVSGCGGGIYIYIHLLVIGG